MRIKEIRMQVMKSRKKEDKKKKIMGVKRLDSEGKRLDNITARRLV